MQAGNRGDKQEWMTQIPFPLYHASSKTATVQDID